MKLALGFFLTESCLGAVLGDVSLPILPLTANKYGCSLIPSTQADPFAKPHGILWYRFDPQIALATETVPDIVTFLYSIILRSKATNFLVKVIIL